MIVLREKDFAMMPYSTYAQQQAQVAYPEYYQQVQQYAQYPQPQAQQYYQQYTNPNYYDGGYDDYGYEETAQPQQNSRHIGRNIALGLGSAALLYHGARKGLMGNKVRRTTNDWFVKAGSKIGSAEMIKSGARDRTIANMRLNGMSRKDMKAQKKAYDSMINNYRFTDPAKQKAAIEAGKNTKLNEQIEKYLEKTKSREKGNRRSLKKQIEELSAGADK